LEVKKQELNYKTNAPSLSKREKEVLQQILMEKNTPQIADALFVSVKTVEMHRANLFLKLGVKNITGLIKKAILFNLVDEI
jgi:DNA-binding CsgD family transcriptional regulator